jgi:hypothetical protein
MVEKKAVAGSLRLYETRPSDNARMLSAFRIAGRYCVEFIGDLLPSGEEQLRKSWTGLDVAG